MQGQPVLEWSNTHWQDPNMASMARDMVLDGDGNAYMAGTIYSQQLYGQCVALIKYDNAGNEIWSLKYGDTLSGNEDVFAMCLDDSNNVYLAGSSSINGWLILKYDFSGNFKWKREHIINQEITAAFDIAVSDSGYVYVSGANNFGQYGVGKYDRNGNQLWIDEDTITASGWSSDPLWTQMTVGNNGAIYITTSDIDDRYYLKTVKYRPSGLKQWERSYRSSYSVGALSGEVQISPSGDIIVLGTFYNSEGGISNILINYTGTGDTNWLTEYSYNGIKDMHTSARGMAIDRAGNIVLAGTLNIQNSVHSKIFTAKFNSSGELLWEKNFRNGRSMLGQSVAFDDFGNIYVVGSGEDSVALPYYRHLSLIKYSAGGDEEWIQTLSRNRAVFPRGVVLRNNTEIFIFGDVSLNGDSLLTLKYSQELPDAEYSFRLYPNPMRSTATLEFPNPLNRPHSLHIIDIGGRLITSYDNITSNSFEIGRENLAEGLYVFRLMEGKSLKATGHLVVQ